MNVVRTWNSSTGAVTHNGPICPTCRRGYIGYTGEHTCSPADLRRIVDELNRRIDEIEHDARLRNRERT